MRKIVKIGVASSLMVVLAITAFMAVGFASAEIAPGNRYRFRTTHGEAQILVDGQWENVSASLEFVMDVSVIGMRTIGLDVVEGTLTIGEHSYSLNGFGAFGLSGRRRAILCGDAGETAQYVLHAFYERKFPMGSISTAICGVINGEDIYAVFWIDGLTVREA